ncbi:peptidase M19 [Hahella sp. CCB-MM4]|uniref:dipeptidase n=1 Tax=Hahella sp. (strain CCB-MM4) TaxID=1926491 RepID=UPI000B9AE67C|nr:dipeptidase [Hahella sp. CCB-MM4]OZG72514.1 peptidase M19 [Hahella sp. CCB-MM4]
MARRLLTATLTTLIIVLALFFGVVPELVDHIANSRLPGDPKVVSPSVESLHKDLFISDLHSDALLWGRDLSKGYNRGHTDLPRLIQGNVALQGFSVVTKVPFGLNLQSNDSQNDMIFWLGVSQTWSTKALGSLFGRAERAANRLQSLADSQTDFFLIRSRQDLQDYLDTRKIDQKILAGWLTLEGAQALEGNLNNLDRLYDLGYRMIAPTHFFDTEIAGSAHGVAKGGLTPLGRQWVKAMEEKSMIIDLAHASRQTIAEVLEMSTRPVIVSHTGVKGTCDNNRNLSDQQLRAIAEKGGIIGIGFWPVAVCGNSVDAIAGAIRYAVGIAGEEHVALGSDFDGAVATPISAPEMDQLTQSLLDAGLSQETIAKVMGDNVKNFLLKYLP